MSSPVQGYVRHPKQKLKKQKVYTLLPTLLGLVLAEAGTTLEAKQGFLCHFFDDQEAVWGLITA